MDSQPLDHEESSNTHQDFWVGDTGHEPNQEIPAPTQADIWQDQKRRIDESGSDDIETVGFVLYLKICLGLLRSCDPLSQKNTHHPFILSFE